MPNGTRPPWCKGVPNLIDISWVVFEDDSIVANGDAALHPTRAVFGLLKSSVTLVDSMPGRVAGID